MGAVAPLDFQRVATLDGRIGVRSNHRNTPKRRELSREGRDRQAHDLFDAGDFPCLRRIILQRPLTVRRRAGDDSYFNARHRNVCAVNGFTGGDVVQVVDANIALADIDEVGFVLERKLFEFRHR